MTQNLRNVDLIIKISKDKNATVQEIVMEKF